MHVYATNIGNLYEVMTRTKLQYHVEQITRIYGRLKRYCTVYKGTVYAAPLHADLEFIVYAAGSTILLSCRL